MNAGGPPKRIVIALGGNALEGAPGNVADQTHAARRALESLRPILQAPHVLISHGNGPQVGTLMLRAEAAVAGYDLPVLPLDTCVADTIGGLGYMLGRELRSVLKSEAAPREVAALITTTLVGALEHAPRKPIGPQCSKDELPAMSARGWELREDERGRIRRVVPSPEPLGILESGVICQLFEAGVVLVAGGGGGVPVRIDEDGSYVGVEAVVDKDLIAAIIAIELRADLLMILTDVDQAYAGYGTPSQRPLATLKVGELRSFLDAGAFGEGSMAPKVLAACRFVEAGGPRAVICHLERATQGAAGTTGTQVVAA